MLQQVCLRTIQAATMVKLDVCVFLNSAAGLLNLSSFFSGGAACTSCLAGNFSAAGTEVLDHSFSQFFYEASFATSIIQNLLLANIQT